MSAPAEATDTELILAARAGDAGAFGELYARWVPWVFRYADSLVGDRHVAEDVTSEAMTAWVRRLNESEAEAAQLAGWLRTVVRNKAADHIRRVTRLRRAVAGVTAVKQGDSPVEAPAIPLERNETRLQVRETLTDLPEKHQLVLEWKYSEGLSVREIADRLGSTEKSVEAALYRARREFRRKYDLQQVEGGNHAPERCDKKCSQERMRSTGEAIAAAPVVAVNLNPQANGAPTSSGAQEANPANEPKGRTDVPR